MTLTEAAAFFKKFFKYALIGLAALVALWFTVGYAISIFKQANPTKETPTVRFGKISKPSLPSTTAPGISFVLDTVDGKLPLLPTVLPVYEFVFPTPNLLDLDRTKAFAADFGFTAAPKTTDNQNYTFTDPKLPQQLIVNDVTKNFSLTTNLSDPTVVKTPPSSSVDEIAAAARDILKSHNLLKDDLSDSQASVTYKKISGSSLVTAGSISDANFVRVDIPRDGVAGYPIVEPKVNESLVYLILSGGIQERTSLIETGFTYWPYLVDSSSTYPVLSSQAAWDAIKAGQATLISPTQANFSEVRVRDIKIAYYEAAIYQPYLQPVFLITGFASPQGSGEIPVTFYLPAVDPSYFSQ